MIIDCPLSYPWTGLSPWASMLSCWTWQPEKFTKSLAHILDTEASLTKALYQGKKQILWIWGWGLQRTVETLNETDGHRILTVTYQEGYFSPFTFLEDGPGLSQDQGKSRFLCAGLITHQLSYYSDGLYFVVPPTSRSFPGKITVTFANPSNPFNHDPVATWKHGMIGG